MKRWIHSGITATILWVFGSLLMASCLVPWLYTGGKALADAAAHHSLPSILEWLGAACDRSKIGRYYSRSILISALLLMPLLFRRLHKIRQTQTSPAWMPTNRLGARTAWLHLSSAALISAGILCLTGLLLSTCGAYEWSARTPTLSAVLTKILLPAIGASLVEEWLFRGILLGIWLQAARPLTAVIGCSLIFSFLHFLQPPVDIIDPTHALVGFEILGKILLHFTDPLFFVADFATLTGVGLILAWARVRTGSLWFPIGLHFGWVLAYKAFSLLHTPVPGHPLYPWGIGPDLRSGIFPLLALALTAVACKRVFRSLCNETTTKPL